MDKFVTKLGVDETGVTEAGKLALRDGNLGSIVMCNRDPTTVMKEFQFKQLKGDMLNLVNQIVDIMTLESGLTRAQLTGITTAETATEAQIGQGGANIRQFARADAVQDFSNRQSRKLWQVIRQFVDLSEVQLITGEEAIDETIRANEGFSFLDTPFNNLPNLYICHKCTIGICEEKSE